MPNATHAAHHLGRDLTQLATSAIALQGYSSSQNAIESFHSVVYPSASAYGIPLNGSTKDMELLLSRFTIGAVSVAALASSDLVIAGEAPWIGEKLVISHWEMIHLISALSVGLQLLLAALGTWLADRVIVPDGEQLPRLVYCNQCWLNGIRLTSCMILRP